MSQYRNLKFEFDFETGKVVLMTEFSPQTVSDLAAIEVALIRGWLTPAAANNLRRWVQRACYRQFHLPLHALIHAGNWRELQRLFWEEIPFGTGGRRGVMAGLGSATINPRTIAESAHGLARYVVRQLAKREPIDETFRPRAIVACDTRQHSVEFARLTACVLAAWGLQVFVCPEPRATPQLSFGVRHLQCHCGVMISASHNPPEDNGFKAYWSDGGQVLPPHDTGIIAFVRECDEIPVADWDEALAAGTITLLGEEFDTAYRDAVCALSLSPARDIHAWYTPLHGVGATSVYAVLKQAGFGGVELDPEQAEPDGNFSTVPDQLPNPERPQALEPAIARAQERGIPLVLATDPDADRIAVAVQDAAGKYQPLTGNEVGALLTDFALRKRKAAGRLSPENYVLETLVTTPLIGRIARSYGVLVRDDLLVGFKYLGRVVEERGGEHFVFAAEESLGYMAGDYCRDKDAALGALWILELAAELHAQGQTLLDRLAELDRDYGIHLSRQVTKSFFGAEGQDRIRYLMERFRAEPPPAPEGVAWSEVRDYQTQTILNLSAQTPVGKFDSPASNLLLYSGAGNGVTVKLAVRPSGTEPKIKFYLFAAAEPGGDLTTRRQQAEQALDQLQQRIAACLE